MTPFLRKLTLTAHISSSVGWLGAVAGFFALAVAGLRVDEPPKVQAAYIAMELATRFVIVPLCFASLLTGVVQSLGTPWGLLRHHWVLAKLFVTVVCTLVLLVHMRPITYLGHMAAERAFTDAEFRGMRLQLVVDAGAALFALLVTTALGVYKPKGMTWYGQRKLRQQRTTTRSMGVA